MRDLTATLEAAQKSPSSLPYVEAKVYDYEQGIKRLHWERVYESGPELDAQHDIAFDAHGDMHRIRVDTGRVLMKLIGQDDAPIASNVFDGYIWADKFTAVAAGPMTIFKIKCSGAGNVKVAVYADNAGAPGALLSAENASQAVTAGWNDITVPSADIVSGTTYWLAFKNDAAIVGRINQAGNVKKYIITGYAGNFPDPFGSPDGTLTNVPDLTAGWQAASAGSLLYHQKVASPDEASDYSNWTEIAADAQGPCAMAACGAKVYIFYRTTPGNVIWKKYSHDYGASWTDAQLSAYADVKSMAAAWWSTGNNVVCFCLKANELKAVVLDSSTQGTGEHIKAFYGGAPHTFTDTHGIGATYDSDNDYMPIVLGAKESDTPYNHYDLWRTRLSNTYNFLALESFLMAPDGEDIVYQYPDCHCPLSTANYETIRITAVENYTGITAYTMHLACHLIKGETWSAATFTEPRLLTPHDSAYGLRMASTATYWWMEKPNDVWRAPRVAADALDITDDIIALNVVASEAWQSPAMTITLDNHSGKYANPGTGSIASLRFRSEIALKLGYKTTAGDESVDAGSYWIDGWEYRSAYPNQSTFTIYALDAWGLADKWNARYQMRWNKDAVGPKTIWQILYLVMARWGIRLWNNPGVSQSSAINNLKPDFTIQPGTPGNTAIRRLLAFVPDRLVIQGQVAFTKELTNFEASSYSYGTDVGDHAILAGEYGDRVPTSHIRTIGRDAADARIVSVGLDWAHLDLGIDILKQDYDPNLTTSAEAQERADAILRIEALQAQQGNILIHANVGQELYDAVELTDKRCGISADIYRVLGIRTAFDARKSTYQQKLTIGAR